MEKIEYKTLTKLQDIKVFLAKILNYTGVELPMAYAESSKIVGIFSQDKMIAGYMLVTKPSFRSLLFIPDRAKKSQKFFKIDQYEMMEVNGLWIGASVKSPKLQFDIWLHLIFDIFQSKKKYLLLMSNSHNKNIEHLHSLTNPQLLYEGAPNLVNGSNSYSNIRVAYTTRWKLVLNLYKYWQELRRRQRRSHRETRVLS
ncbi:MAG: hypothetical protein COA96_15130 [SAR86 cluster bacterium]|uniref:GNAT family N-acetyltransferase n=1 Tax=SAR86 cluster bacterium TaxID=2030880 RepID=A0A2A5ARC4_9GAMM|nr:MAG: hypothetical protein COA96_15130 [SAR86 cluster bacterium]